MACLTIKKCCCCLDLRLACFIIGYISLVCEAIAFIVGSFMAWAINTQPNTDAPPHIYFIKFLVFLFMLMNVLKMILSIGLVKGLSKKRQDQLEMWYKGFLLTLVVEVVMLIIYESVMEPDVTDIGFWFTIVILFITTLLTVYSVLVVRSYYHEMAKESNFYRNITYTHSNGVTGEAVYAEIPIVPDTESLYKKSKQVEVKYEFSKKNGGVVYSTHPSNIPLSPELPPFQGYEKKSGAIYPSLV